MLIVLIPFGAIIGGITGLASLFGRHKNTIGKIAGAAAPIIGGIAGGRARGRQIEGQERLSQDAIRARMHETLTRGILDRARLGADKAQFELQAPSTRFGQAVRGGLAANVQDVGVQVPEHLRRSLVQFTGGLRPSAIGPQGRAAGQRLSELALSRMGQDTFEVPDLPGAPGVSATPRPGFIDRFLSAAGPAASFAGAFNRDDDDSGPTVGRTARPPNLSFLPESPDLLLPGGPPEDRFNFGAPKPLRGRRTF